MKRIVLGWVIAMMLLPVLSIAEEIMPYASEEVASASVLLSKNKKVTYTCILTRSSYKVHVSSCSLYRQTASRVWTYVTSMPDALPNDCTGDMITTCDASDYITESGTYRVKATFEVGSTTTSRTSNSRTFD